MSWFGDLLFGKDPKPTATDAAMSASTAQAGNSARAASASYDNANASFDPSAAFKTYTSGAIGDFNTNLAKQLQTMTGSAVGAGRLNTGFFDQDQGQLVKDMGTNFANTISQQALNVSGQQEADLSRRGNYALGTSQNYNDLLSGALDRQTAQQNAKRQQRSSLYGDVAKVAGSAIALA